MAQHLAAAKAQGPARLLEPRRHLVQAGDQAPQQGQQGIEDEGHHCWGGADAPQHRHREQQAKNRQAGDGLHGVGEPQHELGQPGPPLYQHPQGQGDQQGDGHRQGHHQQVLTAALQDFAGQVGRHGRGGLPGAMVPSWG